MLVDDLEAEVLRWMKIRIGVITYGSYCGSVPANCQVLVASDGNEHIAAQHLYAAMHDMDKRGYDLIIAKRFPYRGVGLALNDRLQRAAAGHSLSKISQKQNS